MAAALKIFDKRTLALAKARLAAWWEGDEFDPDAALVGLQMSQVANEHGADDILFDPVQHPPSPRVVALSKIWGEGRIRPGSDENDAAIPAMIDALPSGRIAILGPGHAQPVIAFHRVFGGGALEVFEWREETIGQIKSGLNREALLDRISVARIDLEAQVWPVAHYDGVWSVDDFAYVGYPPHLAQQFFKMLKPGACAIVECYVGARTPEVTARYASAFASAFAEPNIRSHDDVMQTFLDVGFQFEDDIDVTADFQALAKQGFLNLAEVLAQSEGLQVAAARELAWEAEAWRVRLKLMSARQLERYRFKLRRPADIILEAPPPEAPAPKKNKKKKSTSIGDAEQILKKVLKESGED